MDTDQLALFVDVCRAGGFAPVARERGVAPSSVSRAVAALEADLQARLFHRTTRTLTLTEAGRAFLDRVSPLLEEFDAARSEVADRTRAPSGRLRITASVSYAQIVLSPLLSSFRAACPDVRLDLMVSDARIDLVAERIDIAIRHGALPDSALIARKLHDVRYRLVANPAYLTNAPALVSPADVTTHPVLAFPYEGFQSAWTFRSGERTEHVAIDPVLTAPNALMLRSAARDGMGLALLADWTVEADLAAGRLVEALPDWRVSVDQTEGAVWLVTPSRRFTPAKTDAFAAHLIAAVGAGSP